MTNDEVLSINSHTVVPGEMVISESILEDLNQIRVLSPFEHLDLINTRLDSPRTPEENEEIREELNAIRSQIQHNVKDEGALVLVQRIDQVSARLRR